MRGRTYLSCVKDLSASPYGRRCYLFVAFLALYLALDFGDPSMQGVVADGLVDLRLDLSGPGHVVLSRAHD